MDRKLVDYFTKVYRETGVTIMLQIVMYNRYGYVLKKVKDIE